MPVPNNPYVSRMFFPQTTFDFIFSFFQVSKVTADLLLLSVGLSGACWYDLFMHINSSATNLQIMVGYEAILCFSPKLDSDRLTILQQLFLFKFV